MNNDRQRGPLANTLALHDFKKDPIDIKGWFYYVDEWFRKGGVVPNRMGGRANKNVGYEREKRRLEKENFVSIQEGAWIGALPPKVGTEMFDFLFAADLDCSPHQGTTLVLCWDDQIVRFEKDYLEGLVKDLYPFLEPSYGYYYQREFQYGPSFYPFGIKAGKSVLQENSDSYIKWLDYRSSVAKGKNMWLLRDIYPMNILSEVHLNQKLQNLTLKDWIESSSDRGTLTPLTDSLWGWWVAESQVSDVRENLIHAGLIVCCSST